MQLSIGPPEGSELVVKTVEGVDGLELREQVLGHPLQSDSALLPSRWRN